MIGPTYISEIAPAHMRGRLSSLFQFAIVIGIFSTQVVNQIVLNIAGGSSSNDLGPFHAWQWMFISMIVPAAIYFLLALTLPESPRYLVAINAGDRAKAVLESIFIEPVEAKVAWIARGWSMGRELSGLFVFMPAGTSPCHSRNA